jgi:hypothetical protein
MTNLSPQSIAPSGVGQAVGAFFPPAPGLAISGVEPYRDTTVTTQFTTASTSPGALGVIATCTPGTAGLWEVTGFIAITGTTVGANETNNMAVYQTSTQRYIIPILVASTTGNLFAWPIPPIVLNLSATDTVNVKAIAAATTGAVYLASIVARLVG